MTQLHIEWPTETPRVLAPPEYEVVWPLHKSHFLLPPRAERCYLLTQAPGDSAILQKKPSTKKKKPPRRTVKGITGQRLTHLTKARHDRILDLYFNRFLSLVQVQERTRESQYTVRMVIELAKRDTQMANGSTV